MGILVTSAGLPLLTSTGLVAARAAPSGSAPEISPEPEPKPEPKPEPGEIALHGPASSIAYRGVTFAFSRPVRWYASASGDPVVISHADYLPGGTTITAISPASAVIDGYRAHGAAMDGNGVDGLIDLRSDIGQGFDEIMGTSGFGNSNRAYAYSPARNIDPGNTGAAIEIPQGSALSLVKSVRVLGANGNTPAPVGRYVVLSVMPTLPPTAGTWFRPATSGPKAWTHRTEDVDLSALRDLPPPSGAGLSSVSALRAAIDAENTLTLPFWRNSSERGRRSQVNGENVTYARDMGRKRGRMLCSLHVDPAGKPTEIAARRELAIVMAQWGIDADGAFQAGAPGGAGAGQWYGYLPVHYLAAFLFGDAEMLARAQANAANSVQQCFWVTDLNIGYPVDAHTGSAGGAVMRVGETYTAVDRGIPEWTTGGWHREGYRPEAYVGTNMNASIDTPYRDTSFTTLIYELMPIGLLRNGPSGETGDAAIRDGGYGPGNIRAAAIAYMDRSLTFTPARAGSLMEHDSDSRALYDAWRDHVPQPRWVGRPDVLTDPDLVQFSTSRAGAGEIDFDFRGIDYATGTVSGRDVQVSQDKVQFVDARLVNSGAKDPAVDMMGIMAGFREGTPHWLRYRQINERAAGRWSSTWEFSASANAPASHKLDRGFVTTQGTPSAKLTNVVPPAIMHKPHPSFWMPFYEPVSDAAQVGTFYAGIGYWTGGSGALSAAYQWQRDAGGGFADIPGATAQSYRRSEADSGARIRCVVTVNGASVASAAVSVPARSSFPAGTVIDIDFDGKAPYDWPGFWSEMEAKDAANASWEAIHLPDSRMDTGWTPGVLRIKKAGAWPTFDIALTTSAPVGTLNYLVDVGLGDFAAGETVSADTQIEFLDAAGNVRGGQIVSKNLGAFKRRLTGTFDVAPGDRTIRFRCRHAMATGGMGGTAGGAYLGKIKVWQ